MKNLFLTLVHSSFQFTVFLFCSVQAFGQTATDGDYRTRATGNWSGANTWQVRTSGSWANTSTPPTTGNTVYIQTGHTVTVDASAQGCNSLHINTTGVLAIGTNTVEISGKIRAYTGTAVTAAGADGTFYSGQTNSGTPGASSITTGAGGKFSFIGNSRNLTLTGEWGATLTGAEVEINLTAGQTATLNTNFKAKNWTMTSGTLDANTRILSADNGSSGGTIIIASGFILTSTITGNPLFQRTGSTSASSLTLNSGATIKLGGLSPQIAVTTLSLNGTVEYNRSGAQTLLVAVQSGGSPNTYTNLILSGSNAKTLGVNTTVNGSHTLGGTASLNLGAFALTYGSSGTLVYQGSSAQTATSSEFPSSSGPASLTIDNANGVNFPASFNRGITGVLTLTNGKLSTQSSSVLTLGSAATASGGSSSSFVNGPLAKYGNTGFVFPIGKGSTYARAAITLLSSPDTFTTEYFDTGHPDSLNLGASLTGGRVSSIGYWELSPKGTVSAKVSLFWENNLAQGISSTSASDLVVAHYTSGNWISEGNSVTSGTTSGFVTSNTLSTWSPFTFGSPSKANPLPVTLINFNAKRISENVHLFWSTASEQNADVFLVQRFQKENGFTTIGSVKAAGNSYQLLHYQFIDHAAGTGENCYRLAQLDFDGAEHFSKTVCLSGNSSPKIMIFPNPVNADLNIMSSDELIGKAILFDAAGKEHEVELVKGYGNNWKANISQLPKGVYFLKLEDDIHPMYQRIIKL